MDLLFIFADGGGEGSKIWSFFVDVIDDPMVTLYFDLTKILTYFKPMLNFNTPWKRQKTVGFLTFSGIIEVGHWLKMR